MNCAARWSPGRCGPPRHFSLECRVVVRSTPLHRRTTEKYNTSGLRPVTWPRTGRGASAPAWGALLRGCKTAGKRRARQLRDWTSWVADSRLPPFKKLAASLRHYSAAFSPSRYRPHQRLHRGPQREDQDHPPPRLRAGRSGFRRNRSPVRPESHVVVARYGGARFGWRSLIVQGRLSSRWAGTIVARDLKSPEGYLVRVSRVRGAGAGQRCPS